MIFSRKHAYASAFPLNAKHAGNEHVVVLDDVL